MTGTLVPSNTKDIAKLVSDGSLSFEDLMKLLADAEIEQEEEKAPVAPPSATKVSKALTLSEDNRVVLKTIPTELANASIPSTPVILTDEQAKQLVPLFANLKKATKALKAAEDAIKESFHQSLDLQAPEGSERDVNGHFLTEGEIWVEGLSSKIIRQVNGGGPAGITEADLQALETEGKIDHKTYLALTIKKPAERTIAPTDVIMAYIRKQPELVKALATKARRTSRTTSINVKDA